MIEEQGKVVRAEPGVAWIHTNRKQACTGCQARAGCGVGLFYQALGVRGRDIKVLDPIGTKPGDQVVVGLADNALVSGAVRLYLLPLLLLLAGATVGHYFAGEAGSIFLAIGGLIGGFGLVARFSRRVANNPDFQPVILRRVEEQACVFKGLPVRFEASSPRKVGSD